MILFADKKRYTDFCAVILGTLLGTMSSSMFSTFQQRMQTERPVCELVALNSSVDLTYAISKQLGMPVVHADARRFADGEANILLDTTLLLSKRAVLVAGTHQPVHEHIVDLTLSAFMLKQAGITDIIAVVPYFGYSRQDKGFLPGQPGPAQLIIKLLESAGITQCFALELHSEVIMEHFSIPVKNICADGVIVEHVRKTFADLDDICIVAPDCGALDRAFAIANQLGVAVVMFEKDRCGANKTRIVNVEGACAGKTAIIIDDIIDTGGTAIQTADRLKECGAREIYGYFFHPVLSRNAAQHIQNSSFTGIFVSNSIPLRDEDNVDKIQVFDISGVLADALVEVL